MSDGETSSTIAVVGGGIAGLSAAYELSSRDGRSPGLRIVLVEGDNRLGGKLASGDFADTAVDLGPDGFLARRPEARELCEELGLHDALRPITASGAAVWSKGRRRALPDGLVLGVPTRPWPLIRSRVLSAFGAARASADIVFPRRDIRGPLGDRAIGPLVSKKLGRSVVDVLVDPLVGGIHAGSVADMSAAAVFPLLLVANQGRRSFMRALRRAASAGATQGATPVGTFDTPRRRRFRRGADAPVDPGPPFYALEGGMTTLVDRLHDELVSRGVTIRTSARVERLERVGDENGHWLLHGAGEPFAVKGLVLAVPAPASAALVEPFDQEAATLLRGIDYASVALVTFDYDERAFAEPLTGSGFLVPRTSPSPAADVDDLALVTACTYLSEKWSHLKQPGRVLVRASVGRADDLRADELSDAELVDRVRAEVAGFLGLAEPPLAIRVARWPDSFPQYRVHHLLRVTGIESAVRRLPGVVVAGAAYRGVGIPACIASGRDAARMLQAALSDSPSADQLT